MIPIICEHCGEVIDATKALSAMIGRWAVIYAVTTALIVLVATGVVLYEMHMQTEILQAILRK